MHKKFQPKDALSGADTAAAAVLSTDERLAVAAGQGQAATHQAFAGAGWQRAAALLASHCPPGTAIAVAQSGGPDSQALMAWSAAVAPALGLVHGGGIGIDHGLRAAAAGELDVAEELANELGLPFVRTRVAVPLGGNRLASARAARMQGLRAVAARLMAGPRRQAAPVAILLGHQQDDLAETLLWHLLRGSAQACFTAMPSRAGPFVRPLLGVSRATICEALRAANIPHAIDPTNSQPGRMRAAMRSSLWPAIEAWQPAAKQQLCAGLAALQAEQTALSALAGEGLSQVAGQHHGRPALNLSKWRALLGPLRARVLRQWLLHAGIRPSTAQVAGLVTTLGQGAPAAKAGRRLPHASLPGGTLRWAEPLLLVGLPGDFRPRRPVRAARA